MSPDFRTHPVGRFLLPLIAKHDHGSFEVVCYSDVRQPDELTERLKACADLWRETTRLSDDAAAMTGREDQIDGNST